MQLSFFAVRQKSNMKNLIYVFIGGGFGSVLRFLVSNYTQRLWPLKSFPMGTLAVNIIGCFLIGILIGTFSKTDSYLKFLLITGFCGGFTTFSAFSAENLTLWQSGNCFLSGIYIVTSVLAGISAVYLGMILNAK